MSSFSSAPKLLLSLVELSQPERQERDTHIQVDHRDGGPLLQKKAERIGIVKPGKEKALGVTSLWPSDA